MKLQAMVNEAKSDLVEKRQQLQDVRKMAFENLTGLRHVPNSTGVPPHYEGGNPPTYAA
jgi:hypothetical protein